MSVGSGSCLRREVYAFSLTHETDYVDAIAGRDCSVEYQSARSPSKYSPVSASGACAVTAETATVVTRPRTMQ